MNLNPRKIEYALKHLPIHLIQAGRVEDLQILMTNNEFLDKAQELYGIDWLAHPQVKLVIGETARGNHET